MLLVVTQSNAISNWETVIQTAGLLTQAVVLQEPELYKYDNSDKFINSELYKTIGNRHKFQLQMFDANINVWIFALGAEQADVFGKNAQQLHTVFDLVPVHRDLDETIQLTPSVFHTQDSDLVNIQFFTAPTSL